MKTLGKFKLPQLLTRMSECGQKYIQTLEIDYESLEQIKTGITLDSNFWLHTIIYQDTKNWTQKLLPNSNCHNFLLGCLIADHNISRCSKLEMEVPDKFKLPQLLTRMSDCGPSYNETLEIDYGSSEQIQIVITFESDVWLQTILYRETRNWTWKLLSNSSCHNIWLGCLNSDHNISRRPKLKTEAPAKLKLP